MHHIRTYEDGYTIYELTETGTGSSFRIAPERGGIVTGLNIRGTELFYMDRSTFLDPATNIRGGNPVLFPISGQLEDGQYTWEGSAYRMKNHGFARDLPWEVVGTRTDGEASITLRLASDGRTREMYPFDFELLFTYRLQNGELTIEQSYRNRSDSDMPMYPGFHPYFSADAKTVEFMAERRTVDMSGRDGGSIVLVAPEAGTAFRLGAGPAIRLRYGSPFHYLVLWTVEEKPFVCVEPWMAKSGEFYRGGELVRLKPGEVLRTHMTIGME